MHNGTFCCIQIMYIRHALKIKYAFYEAALGAKDARR